MRICTQSNYGVFMKLNDSNMKMCHAQLCAIAVKWLKRPNSAGGHGCHIALSECRSGWDGEIPDAIGFRATGHHDGSIVVEVKISRADFLADRKKPHRQQGEGMGNWRYYMCPEGMIKQDELPDGWGLLWVNNRGHIKPISGPAAYAKLGFVKFYDQLNAWRKSSDQNREQWLLVKMLHRVGDPEELNVKLKTAYSERQRLAEKCNKQQQELESLRSELRKTRRIEAA